MSAPLACLVAHLFFFRLPACLLEQPPAAARLPPPAVRLPAAACMHAPAATARPLACPHKPNYLAFCRCPRLLTHTTHTHAHPHHAHPRPPTPTPPTPTRPACSIVMPDLRTVYATDDGTNVGFYKFVADKPEDLSSGGCHLE